MHATGAPVPCLCNTWCSLRSALTSWTSEAWHGSCELLRCPLQCCLGRNSLGGRSRRSLSASASSSIYLGIIITPILPRLCQGWQQDIMKCEDKVVWSALNAEGAYKCQILFSHPRSLLLSFINWWSLTTCISQYCQTYLEDIALEWEKSWIHRFEALLWCKYAVTWMDPADLTWVLDAEQPNSQPN